MTFNAAKKSPLLCRMVNSVAWDVIELRSGAVAPDDPWHHHHPHSKLDKAIDNNHTTVKNHTNEREARGQEEIAPPNRHDVTLFATFHRDGRAGLHSRVVLLRPEQTRVSCPRQDPAIAHGGQEGDSIVDLI